MLKKAVLLSAIFSSSIFAFSGCDQQHTKVSSNQEAYPEKIKLKIKKNELTSNDVIGMFNREKNLKNDKSGFEFDNGMKKIKHSKDFKTDINQLFSRQGALIDKNPGMVSENFSFPDEHLQKNNEVLRVTDAITEVNEFDKLREKLLNEDSQSDHGELYSKDFYLHREKYFILLNNKILDFRKKYLIKYYEENDNSVVLHNVADNYTAFLIGFKMKLFAEENKSLSGNQEQKEIRGMKKTEAIYFSTYSENLMNLSKRTENEVVH